MDYAIISLKGKQYTIKPDSTITLPGTYGAVGDLITPDAVLLVKDEAVTIGTPNLDYPIKLTVSALGKTEKIDVATFRSKSRRRRHVGHRQASTTLTFTATPPEVKKTVTKRAKKA